MGITMDKPWFKAKKYGYGWGFPVTWQGWVVFIAYIAFVVWDSQGVDKHSNNVWTYILQVILISILFIVIVYRTGEKPKWHWGKH
jgi:tryptophan-rich sensory protein